jgi:hypothetical protein
LQPHHHVLLAAARELEIPIKLTASIEMSTCTLKYRPHDVGDVENWQEILLATLDLLHSAKLELATVSANDCSTAEVESDPSIQLMSREVV